MAGKKSDLGPTGNHVKDNVQRLRGDLSFAELSRRLSDIGREIPPLGLRRIESGDRRVDADDLVALAVALNVSPVSLLMPRTEDADEQVETTGVEGTVTARKLGRWLREESPFIRDVAADVFFTALGRALPSWRLREVDIVESGLGADVTRFVRERV